jgi:hypothetical protein
LIPAGEQDEDRWRYALPGRDPVRTSPWKKKKNSAMLQEYEDQLAVLALRAARARSGADRTRG